MPAGNKSINFDEYRIFHFCGVGDDMMIRIVCVYGGSGVGYLSFYPKGHVPSASWNPELSRPFLCFEIDRYQEIIETLRFEKPLKIDVAWNGNNVIN